MDSVLNFPLRKLFIKELAFATYNSETSKWEMKIKGRTVSIVLVWLQGKFNQSSSDRQTNVYRFFDSSGEADLYVSFKDAETLQALTPNVSYCRLFAEIDDVNVAEGRVSLKAKKIDPLNGDDVALSDLWLAEVADYHQFLDNCSAVE